jgi:antitoxin ParD1/3/4
MSEFDIYGYNAVMNVSLTPELERLVEEKVESGFYQTASEVVREALRLLHTRDEQLARLRTNVQGGLEQIDGGKATDYRGTDSRKLTADIKARGRRRLSQHATTGAR